MSWSKLVTAQTQLVVEDIPTIKPEEKAYRIQVYLSVKGKLIALRKNEWNIMHELPTHDNVREYVSACPFLDYFSVEMYDTHVTEKYDNTLLRVYNIILSVKGDSISCVDTVTRKEMCVLPCVPDLMPSDVQDYFELFDIIMVGEKLNFNITEWNSMPSKLWIDVYEPFHLVTISP
jgi:hypothetical protein